MATNKSHCEPIAVKLTEKRLRLELEHRALADNAKKFTNFASEMQFLDHIPSQAVSPLKRAVDQVAALHGSFKLIDNIQQRLEDETREFKRAKTESRASLGTFCVKGSGMWSVSI